MGPGQQARGHPQARDGAPEPATTREGGPTPGPPSRYDPLIEDLTCDLDDKTSGQPIHPEEFADYVEWIVHWLGRRGALADDLAPTVYVLTDTHRNKTVYGGTFGSVADAVIAARTRLVTRSKAAAPGDDWVRTRDPETGLRVFTWKPMTLGFTVGEFVIHEARPR